MKKTIALNLLFTLIFFSITSFAAEKKELPPYMEEIGDNRASYTVPRGSKVEKIGAQVVVEPPAEYVARNIFDMEKRLNAFQETQEIFEKKLEEMTTLLDEFKKQIEEIKAFEENQTTAKMNLNKDLEEIKNNLQIIAKNTEEQNTLRKKLENIRDNLKTIQETNP